MGTVSPVVTEVWMRNAKSYIHEALEAGATSFAWDRGFLVRRSLDPCRYVDAYVGPNPVGQRHLLVGIQGTSELGAGQTINSKPVAVYPTWAFGQPLQNLISMVEHPAGLEPGRYHHEDSLLRPTAGQEHRVVITDLPDASLKATKKFLVELAQLQADHPECIMHIHGLYGFRTMFGLGFRSVDFDPRVDAQKGKVYMPHGQAMTYERAADQPKWINLMGMRPSDLRVPRNRCIFNIYSAGWAAKYYRDNVRWASRGKKRAGNQLIVDPDDPISEIVTDNRVMLHNGVRPKEGDKWLCNTCSLQLSCKFFREGAVCTVPGTEPAELAAFFKTTDSDMIIEGLGTLLATQTRRLNRALEMEEEGDVISGEVTKIINTLFDRGVKLAKLVDPKLAAAGAARINFKVDNRTATIQAGSPQQLMAAVVQELVSRGVRREDITPEMVMRIIEEPEDIRAKAIEAAVVERSA